MKIEEAARVLRDMYDKAPAGERAISIHLFGIKYAKEIGSMSPEELVVRANLPVSYCDVIRKMIKLEKYVKSRVNGDADRFAAALRGLVNETTEKTIQSIRDDMAAMEARLNERKTGFPMCRISECMETRT